jgi:hypothetical protein
MEWVKEILGNINFAICNGDWWTGTFDAPDVHFDYSSLFIDTHVENVWNPQLIKWKLKEP